MVGGKNFLIRRYSEDGGKCLQGPTAKMYPISTGNFSQVILTISVFIFTYGMGSFFIQSIYFRIKIGYPGEYMHAHGSASLNHPFYLKKRNVFVVERAHGYEEGGKALFLD
jgi:hypothetical protein